MYCSIDVTKTVTPHVGFQHWSAPSRVLGSPKSVSTSFTTVSERATCVTRCKGRRSLKCSAHGGSVCVCVFANCSSRCYNDLHPTPFFAMAFLTPPPFLQTPARTKWMCHPSLLRVLESASPRQGPTFLRDRGKQSHSSKPKRKKEMKVARFISRFILS